MEAQACDCIRSESGQTRHQMHCVHFIPWLLNVAQDWVGTVGRDAITEAVAAIHQARSDAQRAKLETVWAQSRQGDMDRLNQVQVLRRQVTQLNHKNAHLRGDLRALRARLRAQGDAHQKTLDECRQALTAIVREL